MKTENQSGISKQELDGLNRFSRRQLTEQEVYVFSVTLCDNEVDRDFECFSVSALQALAPLFEGKTGIFDHNAKSTLQTARIFKTWVETDKSKKTANNENYSALKARAYMVRTSENEALIKEIEGGIKKEVSVSCSVASAKCSVCGADMRRRECEHIRGKTYSGKLCFAELSEPTDAYEWSFVAVPAQRAAGVTKNFEKGRYTTENTIEIIRSAKSAVSLSASQVEEIKGFIESLEGYAADAKAYRKSLLSDIERYAHIAMPRVDFKAFVRCCGCLNAEELKTLCSQLKAQATAAFPAETQLAFSAAKAQTDNKAFKI